MQIGYAPCSRPLWSKPGVQAHCGMMLCNFIVNVLFERWSEYFDNYTFRKPQNINRNFQNMEIF